MDKSIRLWRQNEVCRPVNKYSSEYDVNIQRGTIWGNPFSVEEHGDQAIPKFKQYFIDLVRTKAITKDHLEVLRGQRLGCSCKPNPCHGDIIALVVNKIFDDKHSIEDL